MPIASALFRELHQDPRVALAWDPGARRAPHWSRVLVRQCASRPSGSTADEDCLASPAKTSSARLVSQGHWGFKLDATDYHIMALRDLALSGLSYAGACRPRCRLSMSTHTNRSLTLPLAPGLSSLRLLSPDSDPAPLMGCWLFWTPGDHSRRCRSTVSNAWGRRNLASA